MALRFYMKTIVRPSLYQRGESSTQKFTFSNEPDLSMTITVDPATGTFAGQPLKRNITFVLHGHSSSSIEADGCIIDKTCWDENTNTLSISAVIDVASKASIRIT